MLSYKLDCEAFKKRMVDAGKDSPYEGATQWELVHAQKDACAAGCYNQQMRWLELGSNGCWDNFGTVRS